MFFELEPVEGAWCWLEDFELGSGFGRGFCDISIV